jgi:hypothetical protein
MLAAKPKNKKMAFIAAIAAVMLLVSTLYFYYYQGRYQSPLFSGLTITSIFAGSSLAFLIPRSKSLKNA